jgi:hypothetical protein
MRRRRYLATLSATLPLAGCTGGPGDPITMLAVNRDGTAHTVTVWVIQGDALGVANTVEVASEGTGEIGEMAWERGRYRVTVQVDGTVALAEEFRSEEWFNALDVVVASGGAVELNRGRAA